MSDRLLSLEALRAATTRAIGGITWAATLIVLITGLVTGSDRVGMATR